MNNFSRKIPMETNYKVSIDKSFEVAIEGLKKASTIIILEACRNWIFLADTRYTTLYKIDFIPFYLI